MFHKTSLKLASLYLTILMVISLGFSLGVYQLSMQEFERGLRRPLGAGIERRHGDRLTENVITQLMKEREQQFQEARQRLIRRLVFINLVILTSGGWLSYYMAKRTLKPIQEAHEALERFTADASHELRTPITAMQSEIEVALMNPELKMANAREVLNSSLEELTKLTKLTEGMLNLARLKDGKLNKRLIIAGHLIDKAIVRAMPAAKAKGINIKSDGDINSTLHADENYLLQVLTILIDNAIKFSPIKSEVRISTKSHKKTAEISVIDMGAGIKAEDLPFIFDRFYQTDKSRSKNNDNGYGLGLAIAKNIIDLHGGKLAVKSHMKKGSVFTVVLMN